MMEASLTILMPDNWVRDVGKKYPAPIKFIECMPFGESGGRGLIEIYGDSLTANAIIEEIRSHPDVFKVEISNFGDGRISGSIITNKCIACKTLTGSDCFLTSAKSIGDGKVLWRIITGGEGSLASLVSDLKSSGCQVEINSITEIGNEKTITKRQEIIIRLALESGYYECPKRTTLKDLAKIIGISHSTLGEILQRGEKAIIGGYFRNKK